MSNDFSNDFDFGSSDLDYGYDPLADVKTEEDEEDEKAGEFTGVPFLSLSAPDDAPAPVPVAVPEVPAPERIKSLFERFNPRRRVLAGLLRFCNEPRSAAAVAERVNELQKHDFSVYTGANYASLLEDAGALIKTDENGIPFKESPEHAPEIVEVDGVEFLKPGPWREAFWLSTEDARDYLSADDPVSRFKELLARDVKYFDIYLRILDATDAEGGAATAQLNALVDNDPLVQNPRFYTAHFTELLERCEAIRWEGTWVITEIGRMLLDGQIEAPTASDNEE